MLVNGHSCTMIPSLVTLGLAPVTSAIFSKVVVDVLEVIWWLCDATFVISLACSTVQGHKGQPNGSLENRS